MNGYRSAALEAERLTKGARNEALGGRLISREEPAMAVVAAPRRPGIVEDVSRGGAPVTDAERLRTMLRLRSVTARLARAEGTERDLALLADRAHALAMAALQSDALDHLREEIMGVLDIVDAYGRPKARTPIGRAHDGG